MMDAGGADARRARFERNGFLAPVAVLDAAEAARHRGTLEAAEAPFESPHYRAKVYTVPTSPLEPATHPRVPDTVAALIGPDVLLRNATCIVKGPPGTPVHVSWRQDLAYWGLDGEHEVSIRRALSPADEANDRMVRETVSGDAGRPLPAIDP